jgi:hypothetical protein
MKNIAFFLLFALFSLSLFSQNDLKTQLPSELSLKDQEMLLNLPELQLPNNYKNKSIPYMVDNSQLPYFRDMFSQAGMSCGQASSTGICFTYEMNCARDVHANTNENLYPTHFVYNWENGDWGSSGVSYYHTLGVLKNVGTPNQEEYGGTIDYGGNLRWMTGYELYYSAMRNRISGAYCIKNVNSEEGLVTLKHWMNDHLNGSEHGGCAIFYSTVPNPDATLPEGTEEGGKQVITNLNANTAHSMAILGYNDSIRYDYNNDGQYTNHIDINNDGIVDMQDWEIGGIKMCNTYSGGPSWADGGFCYITYKALAGGALWHDLVHVMYAKPFYEPQLTAKATVTYTNRKRIKIVAGMSTNLSATKPDQILDFPIFDYQGGDRYMTGGSLEINKTLEFGLDLTPFLNYLDPGQTARFFLQVTENDADGWGTGQINNFSIIEYSNGTPNETTSSQSDVDIIQNGVTRVWVNKTVNHEPPEIVDETLPVGAILSPYTHTLTGTNGTAPYTWSWDMHYDISQSTETFPSGGTTITTSSYNLVELDFDFPFFGENYHNIYVGSSGLIVFEPGFNPSLPYNNDDDIVFLNTKCIAPFFNTGITSSVKKISNSNSITLIFDNNKIDFAVSLFENGEIQYTYKDNTLNNSDIYTAGISNGDLVNIQNLFFTDQIDINNGFTFNLTPKPIPEEFNISQDGVITGTPIQEYIAENFYIRITDNNNLTSAKILQFITDGLILQFNAYTPDNDLLEYNESVFVNVFAENPMDISATNISLSLNSDDEFVSITDNIANMPDLDQGNFGNLIDAFAFDIAPNVPDQHEAHFIVSVDCDQGNWSYPVHFELVAPEIEPGNIEISDENDNLVAAGETFTAYLEVWNTGHADAENISISFESTDPYLTLLSSNAEITSLAPNTSSLVSFEAEVSESIPFTQNAIISMNINADNEFEAQSEFEITIHTPVIEHMGSIINDGNNSCLDPGETSDIIIGLINSGFINATNLNLSLSTDDEHITINSSDYFIDLINQGDTDISEFNVSVSPDAPMAHLVNFNLNVTGDNGLDINIPINTIVGLLIETWETGDLSAMEWETDGNAEWYPVTNEVYEGNYSLRSGDINDNEVSNLEIQMFIVAEGELSFAYKVSSENNYDFLEFLVDDVVVASWAGEQGWNTYSYNLSEGSHSLMWRFRKDFSVSSGQDCAWIDNITFPSVNNIPPLFTANPDSIAKYMYPDETATDSILLSNLGGGSISIETTTEFFETQSMKSVAGSHITCNTAFFEPGSTIDFIFTVYNGSTDMEWLNSIAINFPEGFFINSSTDFVGGGGGSLFSDNSTGNGANIIWSTTNNYGVIYGNETATCTVNVTIDPMFSSTNVNFEYIIWGDLYGSDPHSINDIITLTNINELWLNIIPEQTTIDYQSEEYLYLNFNTENMFPGIYEAVIHIYHNNDTTDIPVALNIWTVGDETIEQNSGIKVYPNPFDNYFTITIPEDLDQILKIEIIDNSGRIIDELLEDYSSNLRERVWNKGNNIKPGNYFIRIVTKEGINNLKLIKIE